MKKEKSEKGHGKKHEKKETKKQEKAEHKTKIGKALSFLKK